MEHNQNFSTCEIRTRLPSDDERRLFGVFISHSNKEEDLKRVKELVAQMEENGLIPIYDKGFLQGGQDFLIRIQDCIKCYAGVVVITRNSLGSDWVSYECGYFRAQHMPVYLWDPDNLLSLDEGEIDEDLLNTHITQYLPAHLTADSIVKELKERSVYSDLFTHDCPQVSHDQFRQMLDRNVRTVMLRITDKRLTGLSELFRDCKLGTLVVNFGMFYPNQGDGVHCWAQRSKNSQGDYVADEAPLLTNGLCGVTGQKCTLFADDAVYEDKNDCVILNYVMFNGRYFAENEPDFNGDVLHDKGLLSFYIPVHRLYGTEFKFIVDSPNNQKHHDLLCLFEELGLNPTVSDSLNGWRIYLSLPDAPSEGLFRLDHLFNNNFLCPRAQVEPENRADDSDW